MSELEDDILMAYLEQGRQMQGMVKLLKGYQEVHQALSMWLTALPPAARDLVPTREHAILVAAIARVLELEHDFHMLSTPDDENGGP